MPTYRLSLEFKAADDRQANRLGMAWAGFGSVEYGTRNPIVTPIDGELRDRYVEAILQAGDGESVGPHSAATAVLAVRDAELERLRGELGRIQKVAVEIYGEDYAGEEVAAEVERLLGHLSEHEANVQRILQAKNEALENAQNAIERVRALYGRWEQGVVNLYAANEEEGHAVAAIARAARAEEIERCARELRGTLSAPESPANDALTDLRAARKAVDARLEAGFGIVARHIRTALDAPESREHGRDR